MSRWLHYPDWVTIIAQQVLMNVVSVMQADCRMNLLEIFLRWLMRKIFHVRLLPAVSTQPNCLNQLLLFFLTPVNYLPGQVMHFKKPLQIKEELLKQQASNLHEQKKAGVIFEAEEVITLLTSVLKTSSASRTSLSSRHQFAPERQYCIRAIKWCLTGQVRVPTECIEKIEAILKELEKPAP